MAIGDIDEGADAGRGRFGIEAEVFMADAADDRSGSTADAMAGKWTAWLELVGDSHFAGEIVFGPVRARPIEPGVPAQARLGNRPRCVGKKSRVGHGQPMRIVTWVRAAQAFVQTAEEPAD